MKSALWTALISLLFFACSPKQHSGGKENTPEAMVEVHLKIEGMTCDMCEASIHTGVTQLAGVDSVSANYQDSTAYVRFDSSKTNLKAISEAIALRGYEVK